MDIVLIRMKWDFCQKISLGRYLAKNWLLLLIQLYVMNVHQSSVIRELIFPGSIFWQLYKNAYVLFQTKEFTMNSTYKLKYIQSHSWNIGRKSYRNGPREPVFSAESCEKYSFLDWLKYNKGSIMDQWNVTYVWRW